MCEQDIVCEWVWHDKDTVKHWIGWFEKLLHVCKEEGMKKTGGKEEPERKRERPSESRVREGEMEGREGEARQRGKKGENCN